MKWYWLILLGFFSAKISSRMISIQAYKECHTHSLNPLDHIAVSNEIQFINLSFVWFPLRSISQCTQMHAHECDEFTKTGSCSKGKACRLYHRTKKIVSRRTRRSSSSGTKRPRGFSSNHSLHKADEDEKTGTLSPLKAKSKFSKSLISLIKLTFQGKYFVVLSI